MTAASQTDRDHRRVESLRGQLRVAVAELLFLGASRDDIAADLMCATRSLRQPGNRERADGADIAARWAQLDEHSPPF